MGDFLDNPVFNFFRESALPLPINKKVGDVLDGTLAIGLSFIILAYIWQPKIEAAYRRMLAYRAWRAIEKRQTVEVTTYPTLTEAFGRQRPRGCDPVKFIIVALGVIKFASFGLELTMDLYVLDKRAWPLTQPPPVYRNGGEKNSTWIVSAPTFFPPALSLTSWTVPSAAHPPTHRLSSACAPAVAATEARRSTCTYVRGSVYSSWRFFCVPFPPTVVPKVRRLFAASRSCRAHSLSLVPVICMITGVSTAPYCCYVW